MTDEIEAAAAVFSLHDIGGMQDPYQNYIEFRDKCPVAHSREHGGYYFTTRFDASKEVYSDFRHFSSQDGTGLPSQPLKMYPIDLDPPEQTKYRKILNPAFTPEAVAEHQQTIRSIINNLIDSFIEDGSADLASQLIRPTLSSTVLPILGVPLDDVTMISTKLDYLVRHRTTDPEGCTRIGGEMAGYLLGLSAARRTSAPKNDILQTLIESQIDHKPLSDDQIFRVLIIILFGGLDTTSAAISEAILHLARHPQDVNRLKTGDVPWPIAIEEFIRFTSPIQGLRRTVTREIVIEGETLKPGDFVISLNAAANRDPDHFKNPEQCIIDRQNNDHIAFGAGAHICLGRNLARLLLETVLKIVLERLPDYSIAEDFKPEYAVGEARGMKVLPVRFTPGRRLSA